MSNYCLQKLAFQQLQALVAERHCSSIASRHGANWIDTRSISGLRHRLTRAFVGVGVWLSTIQATFLSGNISRWLIRLWPVYKKGRYWNAGKFLIVMKGDFSHEQFKWLRVEGWTLTLSDVADFFKILYICSKYDIVENSSSMEEPTPAIHGLSTNNFNIVSISISILTIL